MNKLSKYEKDLLKYVKRYKKKGIPDDNIKMALIKHGIKPEVIDKMFELSEKKKFRIEFGDKQIPTKEPPKELGIEREPSTITEKIDALNKRVSQIEPKKKGRDKSFDLPFGQNGKLKTLAKQSKLLVIYPTNNRSIKTYISPLKDEWIVIDGKPREVRLDDIFLWQGKYPCIIQPEWDINPFGTVNHEKAVAEGRRASVAANIIKMINSKEQLNKMNMNFNPKVIIAGAIGLVIVLAVLFGNFGGG